MSFLFKNANVVNVFTQEIESGNVLIENGTVIGVGDYDAADQIEDLHGAFVCPGLIDSHIHIESTFLTPAELTKLSLLHGTTTIVADPHEIANVCGTDGIEYMLAASEGLPMTVYLTLPSCVPATALDESGAVLTAEDLRPFYAHERVLGLAEMMNYPGVLSADPAVLQKIRECLSFGKTVDGHAPLLHGKDLDRYLSEGIGSDHECSSAEEAKERIRKGQWVMIREGTAARNLQALVGLFELPWRNRCMLATDDKHPADLIERGHLDGTVRKAVSLGADPIAVITAATINAAQYFGLKRQGAVAPGYRADLLVTEDLRTMRIRDVYCGGKKTVENGVCLPFSSPEIPETMRKKMYSTFQLRELTAQDFRIRPQGERCRVIGVEPGQILTEEQIETLSFSESNGIDLSRDILKIAVAERHRNTGHIGLGYLHGIGLKRGAIASSVSHDSHNLIILGTNEEDMAAAANRVRALGGGNVLACDGKVIAEMPLPIAGLMTECSAAEAAEQNRSMTEAIQAIGINPGISPLMLTAFVSLSVIPRLKLTTHGLVDVNTQQIVPLFV